jgi:hypothetical protein
LSRAAISASVAAQVVKVINDNKEQNQKFHIVDPFIELAKQHVTQSKSVETITKNNFSSGYN